jgi:hypothetical protein
LSIANANCVFLANPKVFQILPASRVKFLRGLRDLHATTWKSSHERATGIALLPCAGADLIIVEAPPDSPEWSGIADRLRRAAA